MTLLPKQRGEIAHLDASRHARSAGYTGKHTGEEFRTPRADGYARYMLCDGPRSCLIQLPYGRLARSQCRISPQARDPEAHRPQKGCRSAFQRPWHPLTFVFVLPEKPMTEEQEVSREYVAPDGTPIVGTPSVSSDAPRSAASFPTDSPTTKARQRYSLERPANRPSRRQDRLPRRRRPQMDLRPAALQTNGKNPFRQKKSSASSSTPKMAGASTPTTP